MRVVVQAQIDQAQPQVTAADSHLALIDEELKGAETIHARNRPPSLKKSDATKYLQDATLSPPSIVQDRTKAPLLRVARFIRPFGIASFSFEPKRVPGQPP
jgi:hypothetical protein